MGVLALGWGCDPTDEPGGGGIDASGSPLPDASAPIAPEFSRLWAEPLETWDQNTVRVDWETVGARRLSLRFAGEELFSTDEADRLSVGSAAVAVSSRPLPVVVEAILEGAGDEVITQSLSIDIAGPFEDPNPVDGAQPLDEGRVVGRLSEVGDIDIYSVAITEKQWLRVWVEGENGRCPSATVLRLQLGPEDVAQDVQEVGTCPRLEPRSNRALVEMSPGVYGIGLMALSGPEDDSRYLLRAEVGDMFCGNGIHETGEQCDDGNDNDGDGCTRDCRKVLSVTLNQDNTRARLTVPANPGFVETFLNIPDTGASLTMRSTSGCPGRFGLALLSNDFFLLGFSNQPLGCPTINPEIDAFAAGLRAGPYGFTAYTWGGDDLEVGVELEFVTPECGNGIVEWRFGETCEPPMGSSSRCGSDCQVVGGIVEVEPNDQEPQVLGPAPVLVAAYLSSRDVDRFYVDVPASGRFDIAVSTSPDDLDACRPKFDPIIGVFSDSGRFVELQSDGRPDGGLCPRASSISLMTPGRHLVVVRGRDQDVEGPYYLSFTPN